ncbi:MAG: pentapeptide repeat-containing protein [Armatimonadota bacterium]
MMRSFAMAFGILALTAAMAGAQQEFTDADLSGTRFVRCDLQRAYVERCRLSELQMTQVTEATKLTLSNCRFGQSQWRYVVLDDPRLEYSRIKGLRGYDVEFDEWAVERSDLTDLYLRYCELREIELENCSVRDLEVEYCALPHGRWRNADLSYSNFEGCDWSDSRFYRGSLEDARFTYVDFSDVVLENCDIRGLVINGVRIDELID